MPWPFPNEQAFWAWADDLDAELQHQDEDLLLHEPDGLILLTAATDNPQCAKQVYCARILEDYARHIIRFGDAGTYPALRAAVDIAARGRDPRPGNGRHTWHECSATVSTPARSTGPRRSRWPLIC